MGFRMRKSIKLAPGVRLNVSKREIGVSVGAGDARYSVQSSGRGTLSARTGIPGVTYQRSAGGRRRARPAPAPLAPAALNKPGLFARKGEKQLYQAIGLQDIKAAQRVGDEHRRFRLIAYSYAGVSLLNEDPGTAKDLLGAVLADGGDPAEHPFSRNYLESKLELPIAPGVRALLPINRDAVGLALAELYRREGDLAKAIEAVEQLEPTTYAAVSLVQLYAQARRFDDVIELSEGLKNEDDASALLLIFRGLAFRQQGYHDAAHETLKEALRVRTRLAPILHLALHERAQNYLAQGKKGMARKDLERILAEDSGYEGVREQLAELSQH